jgi:hypothetical protein
MKKAAYSNISAENSNAVLQNLEVSLLDKQA